MYLQDSGVQFVDVELPSWTPSCSTETLEFVWWQLGDCGIALPVLGRRCTLRRFNTLVPQRRYERVFLGPPNRPTRNPQPRRLDSFTQSDPREKESEYGVNRLTKAREAISARLLDLERTFAERLAKGSEIATILEENHCVALLIPAGCRHPVDLGQCPVFSLPLGFYPSDTETTTDEFGLTSKAPIVPYVSSWDRLPDIIPANSCHIGSAC